MRASSTLRSKCCGTLSSKCQITVPLEVRKRLGLKAGDRVEFVVENDRTVVRPAREEENPFEKFRGIAPLPEGMDSVRWVRDLRDDEYEAEQTLLRLGPAQTPKAKSA